MAARQVETTQRGLLNERYQKGAEMLGSKALSVRLGGIYALDRLAREHPGGYHTQIMNLLCAFVRSHRGVETQVETQVETHSTYRREDVQAAVAAVGSRSAAQIEIEKKEYCRLDFSGADLRRVSFFDAGLNRWDPGSGTLFPANMKNAFLFGANLEGPHLTRANLNGAHLYGANLEDALLIRTDLSGASLEHCKGLTQEQIDQATADFDNPPHLENAVDAVTGEPLVWRGRP